VRQRLAEEELGGAAGVEPGDARIAAEPGLLAAREALGRLDRFLARLLQGELAVQVAEHLLVAQGAAGGLAFAQARADQGAHLGLEAGLPHVVDPGGDALVEVGAGQGEADLDGGMVRTRRLEGGHGGGERAAGDLDDLKGAHDAPAVGGQDRGGRGRVEGGQARVQRGRAEAGELVFQASASTVVRSGKIKIAESGTYVQA
jgi:hypothetical protein